MILQLLVICLTLCYRASKYWKYPKAFCSTLNQLWPILKNSNFIFSLFHFTPHYNSIWTAKTILTKTHRRVKWEDTLYAGPVCIPVFAKKCLVIKKVWNNMSKSSNSYLTMDYERKCQNELHQDQKIEITYYTFKISKNSNPMEKISLGSKTSLRIKIIFIKCE